MSSMPHFTGPDEVPRAELAIVYHAAADRLANLYWQLRTEPGIRQAPTAGARRAEDWARTCYQACFALLEAP